MTKIRLLMTGRKKAPFYRIVVANRRSKRDGQPLEILGSWNQIKEKLIINKEKLDKWIANGAQVTAGVAKLLK